MKFLTLGLEGFKLFREKQELPLADLGLVLVRGDNRISAAMDSNGSGKTSIFDGLSFALFGIDLEGRKADDIACRFTKGLCQVMLDLEVDGKKWTIVRQRRPAGVHLHSHGKGGKSWQDAKEVQDKLDSLLGFGYRTFCNAVVFGQASVERFARKDQAAQMRMLDEIQGLDFRAALDRAKHQRDEGWTRLDRLERDKELLEQKVGQIQQQVEMLEMDRVRFAERKRERIREERELLDQEKAAWKIQQKEYQDLVERASRVRKMGQESKKLEEMKKDGDRLWDTRLGLDSQIEGIAGRREIKEQEVKKLLGQERCPTCRVVLKGPVELEVRNSFRVDFEVLDQQEIELRKESLQVEGQRIKSVGKLEKELWEFLRRYKDLGVEILADVSRLEFETSQVELGKQKELSKGAEVRVREAEMRYKKGKDQLWEGRPDLEKARAEKERVEEELRKVVVEEQRAQREYQIAEYWIEAFGDRGLRSLLFDSVAGFLNERLVDHLESLTAGEADVQVSALSLLKKGTAKEKISVDASWGWGANNYIAGSAGQGRRIDLVLFAALQDLAERRSARPFPLKIYDEAGDTLDQRGKEIFVDWVRADAVRRGSAFLVTHDAEFANWIEADQVWTVILDRRGARVQIQSN